MHEVSHFGIYDGEIFVGYITASYDIDDYWNIAPFT